MMNNWPLLLLFLLIPQFLTEVLLLQLLLLVQLHNVSRIHKQALSSQVKKPVIFQTGRSRIAGDHQTAQEVCHRENPKQEMEVVLGCDVLSKLGALGFEGLVFLIFFFN